MLMKRKFKNILEKWANGKQEADLSEVEQVLDEFFPGKWGYNSKTGSHNLFVEDDSFIGISGINKDMPRFNIPSKNGRHVKPVYLRDIVKAIKRIREISNG